MVGKLEWVGASPPQVPSADAGDVEWSSAADVVSALAEHARAREVNAALLDSFGQAKWQAHANAMEAEADMVEAALRQAKADVEAVNKARMEFAQAIGVELRAQEDAYAAATARVGLLRTELSKAA